MTTNQNLTRADIALADLQANGGMLSPEQANQFIDFVMEEPTVLRQARVVRMNAPRRKINRMGFASRILRAARQVGSAEDDGGNDRYVRKADRAAPQTSQIELNTSEVIAEVRIPYEVLEDNIEGDNFEAHILRQIAQRAALDLEELGLWADTASTDPYLALQDGWMKRALTDGNVLDWNSAGISPDLFASALLSMPQKYLKNLAQMRAWVTHANIIKYRQKVSQRQTGYGDSAIQANIPLQAHGLTMEPAHLMSAGLNGEGGLVTFPQNLLFGIQRDISIESDKDIRSREYIIVLTARVALQIDDADATVAIQEIGGLVNPASAMEVTIVNTEANPVNTKEVAATP